MDLITILISSVSPHINAPYDPMALQARDGDPRRAAPARAGEGSSSEGQGCKKSNFGAFLDRLIMDVP
eukprot:5342247-Pyramimonas_sp.AAC.2